MHNQIDHTLIDKGRHLKLLMSDLLESWLRYWPLSGGWKLRLSVSKWAAQKSDVERFNLKKLNGVKIKEQYQVKISNRFASLENLVNDDVDISRAWERITIWKLSNIESRLLWVETEETMVCWVLRIKRWQEAGWISVDSESKPNKWK